MPVNCVIRFSTAIRTSLSTLSWQRRSLMLKFTQCLPAGLYLGDWTSFVIYFFGSGIIKGLVWGSLCRHIGDLIGTSYSENANFNKRADKWVLSRGPNTCKLQYYLSAYMYLELKMSMQQQGWQMSSIYKYNNVQMEIRST